MNGLDFLDLCHDLAHVSLAFALHGCDRVLQFHDQLSLLLVVVVEDGCHQVLDLFPLFCGEWLEQFPVVDYESQLGSKYVLLLNLVVPHKCVTHYCNQHVHHHDDEEEGSHHKEEPEVRLLRSLASPKSSRGTNFTKQHVKHEQNGFKRRDVHGHVVRSHINFIKLNLVLSHEVEGCRKSAEHDQNDDREVNDVNKYFVEYQNERSNFLIHLQEVQ